MSTNFAPSNPVENNILSPLSYNVPKNKDFANRTIVPENMKDRSPKYQYDETTSEIGKKIGELANLSPKQVDYLIKSYTGIIGQVLIPATTKSTYTNGNIGQNILKPFTSQFISDPLYSNSDVNDFYDNYNKLKTKAADKNFIQNIPSKVKTKEEDLRNDFTKAANTISKINKQIKEANKVGDNQTVRRLKEKIINISQELNKKVE
jgi:hypothetical protein